MRLLIAALVMLIAGATSQIAIAPVIAQGEAFVELAVGDDEPALEWDIDVAGGSPSTDHVTLAPIAVGSGAEFTVAIAGSAAAVTLTAALAADRRLESVGCLDDRTPPTEINPVVDRSSFTLDVVPSRRYRCFATSLPSDSPDLAGAAAAPTQTQTHKPVPRSDSSTPPPAPSPGWPAVVVALVVMAGIALLLRPVRR